MNRDLDKYFRDVDREVSAVQEALADRALLGRIAYRLVDPIPFDLDHPPGVIFTQILSCKFSGC